MNSRAPQKTGCANKLLRWALLFTAALCSVSGCVDMQFPGQGVEMELTGFDTLIEVPKTVSKSSSSIAKKAYFKVRILGFRGGRLAGSGTTTATTGAAQPLNQVKVTVYSPDGEGQVFDKFDKTPRASNCGAVSPLQIAKDSPRGGFQFFIVENEQEFKVCVPFEAYTDKYGEIRFGIEFPLISKPQGINIQVSAGQASQMKTVFAVPEGTDLSTIPGLDVSDATSDVADQTSDQSTQENTSDSSADNSADNANNEIQ